MPPRRSSGNINLLTNPNYLHDVTEAQPKLPFNLSTGTRFDDGYITSVTTNNPTSYTLPEWDLLRLRCNLIMVMRMAGRAGDDTLGLYDSDSEVSLIAIADISRRNSSAHSSTQVDLGPVALASEPSWKISVPFFPSLVHLKGSRKSLTPFLSKVDHLKDRICGICQAW